VTKPSERAVENATVFSPPHTRVTMRTGRASKGFVLEIDDRGLGMDEDELARAHGTLARPADFDPAQDERLGLYVVGRLAERHGIGVTLTRSPYGGTTAVVLLPQAILAPVEPPLAPPAEPDAPADTAAPSGLLPLRPGGRGGGPPPNPAPQSPEGLKANLAPQTLEGLGMNRALRTVEGLGRHPAP
jgi:hypothetical protein